MFANTAERKELLIVFQTYKDLERRNSDPRFDYIKALNEHLRSRVELLLASVEVIETTEIQLRFAELNYDLIERLRADPLVDGACTPQTRASIKISLGTISKLRRLHNIGAQSERDCVRTERQLVAL